MTRHIFWHASLFAFALIIAQLGLIVWWACDRDPPISEVGMPQIRSQTDNLIIISRVWTQHRDCPGVIHRWLVDGVVLQLPDTAVIEGAPIDQPRQTFAFIENPAAMTGEVRYVAQARFICNPLHHIWPLIVNLQQVEIDLGPSG